MAIRKPLVIAGNRTAQLPAGDALSTVDVDITGAAEIGADLVDADEIAVYDASATAIKKSLLSRVWTYISAKITGAISGVLTSNLTDSRAVVSDGSGKLAVSAATSTEVGYLSGVTSAVQTQLNSKLPVASPTFTSFLTGSQIILTSTGTEGGNITLKDKDNVDSCLFDDVSTAIRFYTWSANPKPFDFYTNSTHRMRITATGPILLGTSTDDASGARLQVNGTVNLASGNAYKINNVQIINARKTGWAAATGTATRTTFATSTVTTEQLAQRVKSLIDDLISHGLLGS